MKTLGIREVRASSSVLVEALMQEGEVILTNHGKPFARVLPLLDATQIAKPKVRAVNHLLAKQSLQTTPSEALIAELRQERI